jgi:hypothetical protein
VRSRGGDRPDDDADLPGKSRRRFARGRPEPAEIEEVPQEETGWLDDLRTAKEQRAAIGPGTLAGEARTSKSGRVAPGPPEEDEPAPGTGRDAGPGRRSARVGGEPAGIGGEPEHASRDDEAAPRRGRSGDTATPSEAPAPFRPASAGPPAASPYGRAGLTGRPVSASPPSPVSPLSPASPVSGEGTGRARSSRSWDSGSGEHASGAWQTAPGQPSAGPPAAAPRPSPVSPAPSPATPTSPAHGSRHATPEPGRHTSELNPDPTFTVGDEPGHGRRAIDRGRVGGAAPAAPASGVPLSGNAPEVPPASVRPAPPERPRGRGTAMPPRADFGPAPRPAGEATPGGRPGADFPPGAPPRGDFGRTAGDFGPGARTAVPGVRPASDAGPGSRPGGDAGGLSGRTGFGSGEFASPGRHGDPDDEQPHGRPRRGRPPGDAHSGPASERDVSPTGARHDGDVPEGSRDGGTGRHGVAGRPVSALPDGTSFGSRNTGTHARIRPGVANPESYRGADGGGRHGAPESGRRTGQANPVLPAAPQPGPYAADAPVSAPAAPPAAVAPRRCARVDPAPPG